MLHVPSVVGQQVLAHLVCQDNILTSIIRYASLAQETVFRVQVKAHVRHVVRALLLLRMEHAEDAPYYAQAVLQAILLNVPLVQLD